MQPVLYKQKQNIQWTELTYPNVKWKGKESQTRLPIFSHNRGFREGNRT